MNMKKIVAAASALSLTAAVAVGGTLAWLQKQSNVITNTFTWSEKNNITLTLEETGAQDGTKAYKVVPGGEDDKDPTLKLTTETESWVYVAIDNGMTEYLDITGFDNVGEGAAWTQITGKLPSGVNGTIYAYKDKMAGTDVEIPVFTGVKYHEDLNADEDSDLTGSIVITGFAVQGDAGTTAQEAWNATFGK